MCCRTPSGPVAFPDWSPFHTWLAVMVGVVGVWRCVSGWCVLGDGKLSSRLGAGGGVNGWAVCCWGAGGRA